MAHFTLETRNSARREVTGKDGATLIQGDPEGGRRRARCSMRSGGACATCHVYVALPYGVSFFPMGPGKNRMLATHSFRTFASRLSCQPKLEQRLSGMHVIIAPEDLSNF
jgi:2Fe-2S ferredoxin